MEASTSLPEAATDVVTSQLVSSTTVELATATESIIPTIVDDGQGALSTVSTDQPLATSTTFGFKIRLSLNGTDWHDLAIVPIDHLPERLALPPEALEQLANLSISIESVGRLGEEQVVLLSGMAVELEYEPPQFDPGDPNPQPNFKIDKKIYTSTDGTDEIVLIRRKLPADDQEQLSLWYRPYVGRDFNFNSWNFIVSGQALGESVPPIVRQGNIFWTSDTGGAVYAYDIATQGLSSATVEATSSEYSFAYYDQATETSELTLDLQMDKFDLLPGESIADANDNIIATE